MILDREYVKSKFAEYSGRYDATNPKIALKIVHTYKVSELCDSIARSLNLSEEDVDLAWLIGMLHDIGRFEQIRRYNTFVDAKSVSHAALGVEVLFQDGHIRDYVQDTSEDDIIKSAICYHSDYRIPTDLDERTNMFCNIIRDADKIDIIRVQLDTPLEEIYDVTTYELRNSVVSEPVLNSFHEMHATERRLKTTAVDYVVGHISLAFELVYPRSRELMKQQGFLDKLMDFKSDNPVTMKQFEEIRSFIDRNFYNI